MNRLFFGDNLPWLRDQSIFPDESVDLIYLDPPFNSNVDYNVIFREESGEASRAQFHAFTDTWHWPDAEDTYREFVGTCQLADAVTMLEAFHSALKTSPMMAYLAMMAPRLVELRRVLKSTGSIYLHCDPTASHYLKLVLDSIFGPANFRSEVVWKRTSAHSSAKRYGPVHDLLLYYTKSGSYTWNPIYQEYDQDYLDTFFDQKDANGRRWKRTDLTGAGVRHGETGKPWRDIDVTAKGRHWFVAPAELDKLDAQGKIHWPKKEDGMPRLKQYPEDLPGVPLQDVWTDIRPMHNLAAERLGYPTQKPEALLERIIRASSNKGDAVLDPFCGCGTTIAVAQRLKRRWGGIDITYLAINLIKRRLTAAFGKVPFIEMGQPTDSAGAQHLAELDRFQFQQWAVNLVDARPFREGAGRGADRGVDGLLYFHETKDVRRKILVQAKSGGVKRGDVATLLGDVNNQKAAGGILITLEPPTNAMKKEAVEAGRYTSALWKKRDYPKIQILTVQGLLNGIERPNTPPLEDPFAKAPRTISAEQLPLAAAESQAEYDSDSN